MFRSSFALALFCLSLTCNHPAGPPPIQRTLKANAGPDQTVKVGNYVILDGSASTAGDGDTLIYKWAADRANPVQLWIDPGNPRQTFGFTKEGVYSFILVVNNGLQDSDPDTSTTIVNRRIAVLFEDPILEIQVRYALQNPSGDLTNEAVLQLDSLRAFAWLGRVTSLKGIENCSNLIFLGLSDHRVTDISPLARLTKLEGLGLDQNRAIADVSPLAGMTDLRWLDLQCNQVRDISALKNMSRLTYLNIMTNPISDVSVLGNFKGLTELWMDSSPLGDISALSQLTQLEILWMTVCQVKDITAISPLTELRLLHVGSNQIRDITPLANLRKLERLYADRNQIEDVASLENLTELNLLDLRFNKITNILPLVKNQGLGRADVVSLRGNPLDSISINEYLLTLTNRGVVVLWQ